MPGALGLMQGDSLAVLGCIFKSPAGKKEVYAEC